MGHISKDFITTKAQLKAWLELDAIYYPTQMLPFWKRLKYNLLAHPCMDQYFTWKFVKSLRFAEYHLNNHGFVHKLCRIWYLHKLRQLGYKTGFQIPPNVVGPGLNLPHYGVIIINDNSKLGCNVTLYSGVCIGWKKRGMPCPVIGDNVFIGTGTNIIGDVHIGDNVTIGQNCVIVRNVESDCTIVAQQPKRIN